MLYWLTYYWLAGLLLNSRPPCRSLTSQPEWSSAAERQTEGISSLETLAFCTMNLCGTRGDARGDLWPPRCSPSKRCYESKLRYMSRVIYVGYERIYLSTVHCGWHFLNRSNRWFAHVYLIVLLLLLLLLLFWHFSTVYQQIKMRRVICEYEPHHVDAKLDCKPDLNGNVNWELMVLCLWCHLVYEKGFLTILWFNGHFYYLF